MRAIRFTVWPFAAAWFGGYGLLLILGRFWPSFSLSQLAFTVSFVCLVCALSVLLSSLKSFATDGGRRWLIGVLSFAAVLLGAWLPIPAEYIAPWFGFFCALGGALIGAHLGGRMQDPAHFWPLILVAMAFDGWSVFAASGFTQAIVV